MKHPEAAPRIQGGGASKNLLSVIGKPKAYCSVLQSRPLTIFSFLSKLENYRFTRSRVRALISSLPIALCFSFSVCAQQPFVVDDADVTEHKKFQLQISHEFDVLPRSASPSLRQNTTVFVLNYGLMRDVEIGLDYPLIIISNAAGTTPKTIKGFGDLNFHVKYNFLKEREGKRRPALTVSFAMEMPTGDTAKGLGSGLFDYSLNGVLQKSLTTKTTLRLNGGIVFAGNTSTGLAGIRTRGRVFTAGASLVRQFTPKLNLGFELTGAASSNLHLSAGQLQTQFGGNYQLTEKMSLDFGVLAGKYNNPRVGVQMGMSLDF